MMIPYSLIPIAILLGIYVSIVGIIASRLVSRRDGHHTGGLSAPEFDNSRSWTANARFSFQLDSEEGEIAGRG